ncbi:MAG TPA: universal stress protein, partial [Magnetococcales bacterium]|nr:universal stress protein [Magnetococcales bacterium]
VLNGIGEGTLFFALVFGAVMILRALYTGIREHRITEVDATPLPALASRENFSRFLVASDGSDFSAAAVREAFGLAQKCASKVYVMSLVATGTEYGGLGQSILKQEITQAQTLLDDIQKDAVSLGLSCETLVINGQVVDHEIISQAERLHTDLIVMGRRGRRGLARMMLGHATANVIGKSHYNVLVVPRAAHIDGRHMVLATDGSRHADRAAITAGELAKKCRMPITVVSVVEADAQADLRSKAEQTVQRVVDYLKREKITVEGHVMLGRPDAKIIEVAQEKNADLIVVGSHGLTGLERILVGSTTERILNGTSTAVLVVKEG